MLKISVKAIKKSGSRVSKCALVRRPVERPEDKKLNLCLRQRGASGLLRIVNKSTSFLSFIRSKIGSHLSLENKLTDG